MAQRDWTAFAVLLIDVQEDFWPDEVRRAFPHFEANVRGLLDFCRNGELDVIHLHASFAPDQSNWMARYRLSGRIPCIEGTGGEKVLSCAAPLPGERVLKKQTFDCFLQPQLPALLDQLGKRYLLMAGIETSVCVLSSALSATQRGFLGAVIGDCCADKPEKHTVTLNGYPFGFDVVNHNELEDAHERWAEELARLSNILP